MTREDVLQIFKSGFHKLQLKKVVKLGKSKERLGVPCIVCLGLFEFVPPKQVWDGEIDDNFFRAVLGEFSKELSNCITKKFTRKVMKNGNLKSSQVSRYVFDVIPKNVLAFKFNRATKTLKLVVQGYGFEK